jgi:hypothetical protein
MLTPIDDLDLVETHHWNTQGLPGEIAETLEIADDELRTSK